MRRFTVLGLLISLVLIGVFVEFGPVWGVRLMAVVGLFQSAQAMREGRVAVYGSGPDPAFFITGKAATVVLLAMMTLFLSMLIFAEKFARFF